MEFKVQIFGAHHPNANQYTIEGDTLIDAVKDRFYDILKNSTKKHVPFRFPMTVTPRYKKEILGGKGGVELHLEWMYSDHLRKPEWKHVHDIWIHASESDLTDTTPFVVVGK